MSDKEHESRIVIIMVCISIGIVTSLFSCVKSGTTAKTVGDLTGGKSPLYIKEDDEYIPFIVVTDQYKKGSALLLRQEILTDDHTMNRNSSYYKGSEIDTWLNKEYLASLGEEQLKIINTDLTITAEKSIGYSAGETEVIQRKVFLLSCEELGFDTSTNMAKEGKKLSFFNKVNNRIALKGNKPAAWLLRTPDTYFLTGCYAVGADGSLDIINVYDETGVRPAFCVDKSLEIVSKEVTEGRNIYVLR